jgi:chromosome segregation ATPase
MTERFDTELKARVESVLDHEPVTEAALRRLLEEGRACILILRARLARTEAKLTELAADPETSLADTATTFRALAEVRADLEELEALLDALEDRARVARASWLSSSVAH